MSTILPFLCLILGIVLTLGAIYLIVRRGVVQLAVANTYRDVAQQRGLIVDTRGVSLRGYLDQRRIWLGEVMEGFGTERRLEYRGVLALERPLGLGFTARRRSLRERWFRSKRRVEYSSGDVSLDALLYVSGDDPGQVRALFSSELRENLRRLLPKYDISITDEEVRVKLSDPLYDAVSLQALIDDLISLARAVDEARRAVPTPSSLEALIEPWRAVAKRLGLEFEPAFPAMTGWLDDRRLLVAVRREAGDYAAGLQLLFRPHRELGLLLRPQIEPDGYWNVGQDIQVHDAAFDQAFVVKGWDPRAVAAALNSEARQALLALHAQHHVVVDDRGLWLRGVPTDADALAKAIEQAGQVAKTLGW